MGEVSTIGLDIAKSVFQVHGVDDDGAVVTSEPCKGFGVLRNFAVLPRWHRGLPYGASLEPQASGAGSHRKTDAAELCEGLSQTQQERCQRRCRHLRGGNAAVDAIRTRRAAP